MEIAAEPNQKEQTCSLPVSADAAAHVVLFLFRNTFRIASGPELVSMKFCQQRKGARNGHRRRVVSVLTRVVFAMLRVGIREGGGTGSMWQDL